MISLLDLPAEIRSQIWSLCLVSPTGTVQPISRREAFHFGYPNSCSLSGPYFYLVVDEGNLFISNSGAGNCYNESRTVNLSLPRTCRQIFLETNELFWTCNAFYFRSPYRLAQIFHGAGQYPFRRITSIRLELYPALGNELLVFDHTMQLLHKQARSSPLRQLELVLSLNSIIHLATMKHGQNFYFGTNVPGLKLTYQKILTSLYAAHHLHHVEKKLLIRDNHYLIMVESVHELAVAGEFDGVLREIQETWVGKPQSWPMVVCDQNISPTTR